MISHLWYVFEKLNKNFVKLLAEMKREPPKLDVCLHNFQDTHLYWKQPTKCKQEVNKKVSAFLRVSKLCGQMSSVIILGESSWFWESQHDCGQELSETWVLRSYLLNCDHKWYLIQLDQRSQQKPPSAAWHSGHLFSWRGRIFSTFPFRHPKELPLFENNSWQKQKENMGGFKTQWNEENGHLWSVS